MFKMFPRDQELYNNDYDHNYEYKHNYNTSGLQTERRQWNKSNQMLNLDFPDQEKIMLNKKRYEEYLFKLHMNNQLMKLANKKDEKEEKLEKLEGGFSTYVNGAHKKGEKYTPRHTVTKSSENKKFYNYKPNVHKLNESDYNELLTNRTKTTPSPVIKTTRKQWGNSSFIIKTTDGYEIKINAPNSSQHPNSKSEPVPRNEFTYSDDFESDSDTETKQKNNSTNKTNDNKNLIQSVMFSDDSDSDDDYEASNKNDKKFVFDLSRKDIKTLRQSINFLEISDLKESLNEIETDSEIDSDQDEKLSKKSQVKNHFKKTFDDSLRESDEEEIEEELENDDTNQSGICEMILNQVANLKPEDRMNLVKFLSKVDNSSRKSDSKTKFK